MLSGASPSGARTFLHRLKPAAIAWPTPRASLLPERGLASATLKHRDGSVERHSSDAPQSHIKQGGPDLRCEISLCMGVDYIHFGLILVAAEFYALSGLVVVVSEGV